MQGKDALQRRLTAALASRSHGVEMSIDEVEVASFFQKAADAMHADELEFVAISQEFAALLTRAQRLSTTPAGMLFIIRGRVGAQPKRFIAAIKAESHDGFGASASANDVTVSYLEQLLLTPTQRLYKVGLLLEDQSAARLSPGAYNPRDYRAFLFDHLITAIETRQAAQFFYAGFLGMGIQKSIKKLTQDFFDHTRNFIASSSLDDEDKAGMREALRTELRSNSATFNADEFADRHMTNEIRTQYGEYLQAKNFPRQSIVKDTEYVRARLKKPRKLSFAQGIKLLIPSDVSPDFISVARSGENNTVITIPGAFTESD
jgi:hypothetical protein